MTNGLFNSGDETTPAGEPVEPRTGEYVVVARRYRPQAFEELIGQEHVARGLSGAILTHRVGHAYLFTGARGVGKTSAARILAKALNCVKGPTPTPCNECDNCRSISSGDDVDVLEIDGASNRGIDEIRQLRQNVNIRPSRAKFKVYIIDEVHMLTREAFNALLKTLEEPPEHVKFIFCTTEPEKIPITILSRCQRYDFAGIQASSIAQRLRQIVEAEGVEAESEALAILARRAAGSMRDSQSLLEQLLAFGAKRLTAADVHAMLGTAGGERLGRMVGHLVERDAAAALADLDAALTEGVDVGQLLDQLLGYFRDVMAAAVGCGEETLLHTSPSDQPSVAAAAKRLGLETILAMMQILDHTLSRLRYSTYGRTLAELALVRIAKLDNLDSLADIAAELRRGSAGGPSRTVSATSVLPKKKPELAAAASPDSVGQRGSPDSPRSEAANLDSPPIAEGLRPENAWDAYRRAVAMLEDMTADSAGLASGVAIRAPNKLAVIFSAKYNFGKTFCERPDRAAKLEEALAQVVGERVRLEFVVEEAPAGEGPAEPKRPPTGRQRQAELMKNPVVRRAVELFNARPVLLERADV